jgi:hypothetical protein
MSQTERAKYLTDLCGSDDLQVGPRWPKTSSRPRDPAGPSGGLMPRRSMNQIIITEYYDLAQSGNFWAIVLVPFGTA